MFYLVFLMLEAHRFPARIRVGSLRNGLTTC